RTRAAYRRARRLRADDPIAQAHLCNREYRAAMHQRRSAAAARWLQRGLRLLEGQPDECALGLRADLRYMLAHSQQQRGRPKQALQWAKRAHEDAVRAGNRSAEAASSLLQDWALIALGR